jgi:hypothetical protein
MAATKIDPSTAGMGPVPEANRPGHHPEVEQDKPVLPPRVEQPATESFLFRFDPLMLPAAAAAGVLPAMTGIDVGEDVRIRFGIWGMTFPRAAVTGVEVTGPYSLLKVVGPPRLSLADGGITFATSRQKGLCICLAEPQPGPYPFLRHRGVTVTVESPEALAEALLP